MTALELFTQFFEVKTQAHHLHHITTSYAEHKALGTFYEKWDELADNFIETYTGRYGRTSGDMNIHITSFLDTKIYIDSIAMTLQSNTVRDLLSELDTDMSNILDEMLELCNHTSYLLTLK